MSFRPRSYPHPVLSPYSKDYVDGSEFFGSFERRSENGFLVVDYVLTLKSARLNEFCLPGVGAKIYLDVYVSGTRLRNLVQSDGLSGSLKLPESAIHGTVEITPLLVAQQDVALEFAGINAEYSSTQFAVKQGDLLAHGPTEALEADHQRSSTDSESWIKFSLDPKLASDEYEIAPVNDAIIVYTGTNVQTVLGAMRADPNMKPYLFMSIYKDVFIEAVATILDRYKNEDEADEPWAKGLTHYIDSKEMSLSEILDDDRNSIQKFVLRMLAGDGIAEIAKRLKDGRPLS
jgi:hypothetical protein